MRQDIEGVTILGGLTLMFMAAFLVGYFTGQRGVDMQTVEQASEHVECVMEVKP